MDSGFRSIFFPPELVWLGHGHQEVGHRYESNIYDFGSLVCMMYFDTGPCTTFWDTETYPDKPCTTSRVRTSLYKPYSESGVHGNVWQLIQQCLSLEDKPTIDEIVQEMGAWKV